MVKGEVWRVGGGEIDVVRFRRFGDRRRARPAGAGSRSVERDTSPPHSPCHPPLPTTPTPPRKRKWGSTAVHNAVKHTIIVPSLIPTLRCVTQRMQLGQRVSLRVRNVTRSTRPRRCWSDTRRLDILRRLQATRHLAAPSTCSTLSQRRIWPRTGKW